MPSNIVKPLQWWDWNRTHPLAAGVVGYWPMWEGMGDTVGDVAGGNTGTFVNDPVWTPGQDGIVVSVQATDKIEVPHTEVLEFAGTASFSVAAWLRRTTTGSTSIVCEKRDSSNDGWSVFFSADKMGMKINGSTVVSTATFTDTDRYHLFTFVRNGTTSRITYFDNQPGEILAGTANSVNTSAALAIGNVSFGTGNALLGVLGSVAIYNRALSPGEIALLSQDPFILSRRPSNLATLAAATIGGAPPAGFIPYPHPLLNNMSGGLSI